MRRAENVIRRAHHPKHRVNYRYAHARGDNAHYYRNKYGCMHRVVQPNVVLRAVGLGYNNACAHRQAGAQPDKHVYYAARAADSRQRLFTHKLAHNDCVHSIIKLLKQQSRRQRQRKCYQQPPYRSARHVRIGALNMSLNSSVNLLFFLAYLFQFHALSFSCNILYILLYIMISHRMDLSKAQAPLFMPSPSIG